MNFPIPSLQDSSPPDMPLLSWLSLSSPSARAFVPAMPTVLVAAPDHQCLPLPLAPTPCLYPLPLPLAPTPCPYPLPLPLTPTPCPYPLPLLLAPTPCLSPLPMPLPCICKPTCHFPCTHALALTPPHVNASTPGSALGSPFTSTKPLKPSPHVT